MKHHNYTKYLDKTTTIDHFTKDILVKEVSKFMESNQVLESRG